jgi:hypothetical protein
MPSAEVAKSVKWIDDQLSGKQSDQPASLNRGQINITPNICTRVYPGPADSAIYNTGDNELSIADKMAKNGVSWVESDKRPGSRINGASLFCDMLDAAVKGRLSESGIPEEPSFYVFSNCRGWISRIPVLPRDTKKPDDVDTSAEDHDWDATRYRTLAIRRNGGTVEKLRM